MTAEEAAGVEHRVVVLDAAPVPVGFQTSAITGDDADVAVDDIDDEEGRRCDTNRYESLNLIEFDIVAPKFVDR